MQCLMCSEPKINQIRDFPLCLAHKYLEKACLICFQNAITKKYRKVILYHCLKCNIRIRTHKLCLEMFADCAAKELCCFFCFDPGFRDYVLSKGIPVPEDECIFNEDDPNEEITCDACSRDLSRDDDVDLRGCQACGILFHEGCLSKLKNDFYCNVCISVFRTEESPKSAQEEEIQEMPSQAEEYNDLGTIDLSTDSENDDPEHLFDLMDKQPLKRPSRMPVPLPPGPAPRCRIDPDLHYSVYHSEEYRHNQFQ